MSRLSVFLALVLVVALAGGAAFLATWNIPPPSAKVEKVLPDDRFPR
ncbi:MAG TPA: hypothetical protein VGB90_00155 [Alphaproteobacteria bacterium]|jgi:hypothetical protein